MAKKREDVIIKGLTKAVIITLATGAVITLALAFPGLGYLYKAFKKEQWEEARRRGTLKITIKRLEKQSLVSWSEQDGELTLNLTEEGKKKVLKYKIDDLKIRKPVKWDGWWRVIVFDIPEEQKIAREMFRNKLKDLEFYQLQKSVFVCPYECKDEIDFLSHAFEVAPYIHIIKAKEISNLSYNFFKRSHKLV